MALAYSIVKHDPPRDMRSAAQLRCVECSDTENLIIAGMGNNPEKIEKTFIRLGWDANVHNASKNWCPKCVRQRRIREPVVNPPIPVGAKVFMRPTIAAPEVKPEAAKAAPWASNKIIPDHFAVPLTAGTRTSSSKGDQPVTDIRKLSSDQKSSLRTALEAYFNPDTGQFEKDWNDHRISEELQVPRAIVSEFREIFFGEIKVDPEVVAFQQMYEDAKRTMGNLQSSLEKMHTRLEALLKKHGME